MADTEKTKPTMRAISLDEIPQRTNPGKAGPFIDEFLASGAEAAVVENAKKGFSTTLRRYAKDNGAPVKVVSRNGELYLQRA